MSNATSNLVSDLDLHALTHAYAVNPSLLFCEQVVSCLKELQARRVEVEKYKAWAASCDQTPPETSRDAEDAARYRAIRSARVGVHGHCEIWSVAYAGRQLDEAVDVVRGAVKTTTAQCDTKCFDFPRCECGRGAP